MPHDMRSDIRDYLTASITAFLAAREDGALHDSVVRAAEAIDDAFKRRFRLYVAGNGGSAADAQHFAAELVGWFKKGDAPRPAIALSTDTSFLTAWGNDDDFNNIFARQLQAHAQDGDVFFAISTSGNSENILRGLKAAGECGMTRIGLLGRTGGQAAALCEIPLLVPADATPHVQELHIAVIHAICKHIDRT